METAPWERGINLSLEEWVETGHVKEGKGDVREGTVLFVMK